jgi:DNA-binding IclR family transcriptional regulator
MEPNASTQSISTVSAERSTSGSQTLLRGLDVVEAVVDGPMPLAELSARLGLARTTTHRLASALVDREYLVFRMREGYSLGPKLLELGYRAKQQLPLARVAAPFLEQLARTTEDTVHLGVVDGTWALYLDKIEGRRRVVIGSRIGDRHPIAITGLGKALVLDDSEDRWREIFQANVPEPQARQQLAVWLERMRGYARSGYAFDLEENEDQIRCVAAPIRDASNAIVAAISVASAAQYMDDARMHALIPLVRETTFQISRQLGWLPPSSEG